MASPSLDRQVAPHSCRALAIGVAFHHAADRRGVQMRQSLRGGGVVELQGGLIQRNRHSDADRVIGNDARILQRHREIHAFPGIVVLGHLADGLSGLRIGVLQEGFDDAETDVRDLVMAAIAVLAEAGADVSNVSVPEHHAISAAYSALTGEGALAMFKTGFFGAFTRTYYPASIITAINKMWETQADVLPPRTKVSLIAAELSRRNYHGRAYAKSQNVRPTYIKAYDDALANVDLLVMPTCIMTAPKNHTPGSYLEAVEHNLASGNSGGSRNTMPFNYTGHPALALPVGKSTAGLPVSMQIVGRFFDDPLVMRAAYAYQQSTDWDKIIGVKT